MCYEKILLQWPNAELTFLIVIYHSSLVKGTSNLVFLQLLSDLKLPYHITAVSAKPALPFTI
jgi:hypothetical protein